MSAPPPLVSLGHRSSAGLSDRGRGVLVFDSNGVNPYGLELRAVIGHSCRALLVGPSDLAGPPTATQRRSLRPTRSTPRRHDLLVEVLAVMRVCLAALSGTAVVVVWARPYQQALLGLAALVRDAVVVVEHNPGSGRDEPVGLRRTARQLLLRHARVVVHGEELARRARQSGRRRVSTAVHPPYCEWVRTHGAHRGASSTPTFLVLGEARGDKWGPDGLTRLVDVFAALPDRRLLLCVRPGLDGLALPSNVLDASRATVIPDEDIAAALSTADVLLAPYLNPTESGTVHLALSAGLEVLAFRGGMLSEYLPEAFLVPPGDWEELAQRIGGWRARRPVHDVREQLVRCRADWHELLSGTA